MKVKEYLVNRISDLESDLKQARNEYAGVSYELSRRDNIINEQKKLIDDFQMEREHIKQIITCNIAEALHCPGRYEIDLNSTEDDFKTLMAILDIKSEDYAGSQNVPVHKSEDIEKLCRNCKHLKTPTNEPSCNTCIAYDNWERRTANAETTD